MTKRFLLFLFFSFLILGLVTRFYDLSWGAPYFFHPDERNIAFSIAQLKFPGQLNPHFFAYGSLPIYTTYFAGILANIFSSCRFLTTHCNLFAVSFENAIFLLRFVSAIFSLLLLWLLYLTGKKLQDRKTGFLAAFFGLTSIGLIQFSHFGTFEMWLTFFTSLLFLLSLSFWQKPQLKTWVAISLCFAVLIATKISSLVLFPFILLLLFTPSLKRKQYMQRFLFLLTFSIIVLISYMISNPFALLDFPSFSSSMNYESSVALGTLPVFYTGEFVAAIPLLFHFLHVYPFLLNPLGTLLLVPSVVFVILTGIKKRNITLLLLIGYTALLFFSQAFLYVKWTRYVIPTLPFLYFILALFVRWVVLELKHKIRLYSVIFLLLFFFVSIFFAFAFFKTVYLSQDTRIAGARFAKNHLSPNSHILSEVYDLGIVPFNASFPNITLFNFYDLDTGSTGSSPQRLKDILQTTDAIILPSQRIAKVRLLDQKDFPQGHRFYTDLFNGKLRFQKIYETPCDFFCTITYWGDPVFSFEETATVFDRPTVFIFKKIKG